jgi:predicted dehydrogenase
MSTTSLASPRGSAGGAGHRPLALAFLGCGFITRVHSRTLRGAAVTCSYASRDAARAEAFRRDFGGRKSYGDYSAALADPAIDAVVVAVPPVYHLDLVVRALDAGKHVVVEKPALLSTADYLAAIEARDRAGRVVLVGENDHYKPLVATLRRLLAEDAIGDLVLAHFVTVANRPKAAGDWRNDEAMAGGDAFFEEGIHWLHVAGSLGPRITAIQGFRPPAAPDGPDRRSRSMLVAFQYDTGAAGALYYSREIPSLFQGLRMSKLFGRGGVISFESNGAIVVVRGRGVPRVILPGLLRDIRGYRAMYRDFLAAIRDARPPAMSLERALEDHRLMEGVYSGTRGGSAPRTSSTWERTGSGREPGAGSPEPDRVG